MKDRYDFFLSGPIGNVANYKERFADLRLDGQRRVAVPCIL